MMKHKIGKMTLEQSGTGVLNALKQNSTATDAIVLLLDQDNGKFFADAFTKSPKDLDKMLEMIEALKVSIETQKSIEHAKTLNLGEL